MSPSRYFIAAAIVLLPGAVALPFGQFAMTAASQSSDLSAQAYGVWGTFVLAVAYGGPVVLTLAGIISLFLRDDVRVRD